MFLIDSKGGTKTMRAVADDVVYETLKRLMPRKRSIFLDIEVTNTLKEGAYGLAYSYIEPDEGRFNYIEIENKPRNLYTYIETLCHECVHIKQYERGELKDVRGKQMWKGKDCTDLSYSKQPWEKEAFSLQKDLAKAYLKSKGKTMAWAKRTSVRDTEALKGLDLV